MDKNIERMARLLQQADYPDYKEFAKRLHDLGHTIVPREATANILFDGRSALLDCRGLDNSWRAMIAAVEAEDG